MLVDYHLDESDGLAAIADIRWKLGAEIPAVLITADRSPDLRRARAEGRHPRPQQAAEAGRAAGADDAMARVARPAAE